VVPRLAGDPAGVSLLSGLLTYAPEARLTAACALSHPWFDDVPQAIADRAAAAAAAAGPCLDLAPASLLVARP
jgi:cyclin-dependent kinase 2